MATNPMITSRVDPSVIDRIDACAAATNTAKEPGARPVDRGAIVRLLVLRALPNMEAELGLTARRPAKPSRAPKERKAPPKA